MVGKTAGAEVGLRLVVGTVEVEVADDAVGVAESEIDVIEPLV